MMASLFWTIATSYTALIIDSVVLLVALVVGYFPLARYLPIVGPYVETAKLLFAVMLFVTGVVIGHRIADESAELARVKTDLAFSKLQLDAQKQSAETAAKLRADAETQAQTANQKVKDYEDRLSKLPAKCGCDFDDDDVRSLHDIAR